MFANQPVFRMSRDNRLLMVLLLFTAFDLLLIAVRIYVLNFDLGDVYQWPDIRINRGTSGTFFFLVWNLFLAWVPYLIARGVDSCFARSGSLFLLALGFFGWLLFFPNAPYIVTDLLHLRDRPFVPHWYDLILFTSFAWTGLLLGFASLHRMQRIIARHFSAWLAQLTAFFALVLGSYGVYIGRFQRWNSWDLFSQPVALLRDICTPFLYPAESLHTWGVTVVMAGFLTMGYLAFVVWGEEAKDA